MIRTRKSSARGQTRGTAPRRRPASAVKVKRVYEERSADEGTRVLIDRLWPRGIAKSARRWDRWLRELAPSTDLRKWYGHDPARFAEFERRYRAELDTQSDAIAMLRAEARRPGLTLLTATREPALSHAEVLRKVLSEPDRRRR